MEYKQIYARQKAAEERIIKHFNDPTTHGGIYVFSRFNIERNTMCYYIGQAKNLRRRIAQHLLEHDHIAVSLKKYGLYSEENLSGWKCSWTFATQAELDEKERRLIAAYNNMPNAEIYNITSGGQGEGKTDINQRAERKGYYSGKQDGYNKACAEIAVMIEKYTTGITSKNGKLAEKMTNKLLEKLKGEAQ